MLGPCFKVVMKIFVKFRDIFGFALNISSHNSVFINKEVSVIASKLPNLVECLDVREQQCSTCIAMRITFRC